MRGLFAIPFAGMGGDAMIEGLAVDILRVLGQMMAHPNGQLSIDVVWNVEKVSASAGMQQGKASPSGRRLALQ